MEDVASVLLPMLIDEVRRQGKQWVDDREGWGSWGGLGGRGFAHVKGRARGRNPTLNSLFRATSRVASRQRQSVWYVTELFDPATLEPLARSFWLLFHCFISFSFSWSICRHLGTDIMKVSYPLLLLFFYVCIGLFSSPFICSNLGIGLLGPLTRSGNLIWPQTSFPNK